MKIIEREFIQKYIFFRLSQNFYEFVFNNPKLTFLLTTSDVFLITAITSNKLQSTHNTSLSHGINNGCCSCSHYEYTSDHLHTAKQIEAK